jgi:phospholipase/carboxylesterase
MASVGTPPGGFVHHFQPASGGLTLTLLLLHGTGGDEHDLLPLGRAVAPGAALLSPRGPVRERGMPRFFRRLAPGVFDQEDLVRRADDLATFVADACRAYRRDPAQVVALGYSNGANIAAAVLLLRPTALAGAALLRPLLPLRPAVLPDLRGTPVLIAAGSDDPLVPADSARELAEVLRQAGADVTLQWRTGGHGLTAEDVTEVARWLRHPKNRKRFWGARPPLICHVPRTTP